MRTKKRQETVQLNQQWSWGRQILAYTGLFLLAAACVYAAFFIYEKTLLKGVGNVDGLTQHYPSYTKIKRVLSQGGEAWSWDVGLGSSFFDTFKGKLTNPLTYILIAFPQKYLDLAYDFVTVLRQYLTGVAFIFFGRELKLNNEQNVLGALCYAFSGWAILATITQGTFTNAMLLFPFLIMGVERILKGKSPLVFIAAEVMFLASTVIWAYAAGIFAILYYLVRYAYYYDRNGILHQTALNRSESAASNGCPDANSITGKNSISAGANPSSNASEDANRKSDFRREFGCRFGAFVVYGIVGLMISALYVESILYSTTSAVVNSGYDVNQGIFYSLKSYFLLPTTLLSISEANESYSMVFTGLLAATLFPLIIRNIRRKRSTASIMAAFCLLIGLFPITGRIMNGMSYSVGRWYFILTFFVVWAAVECLDHEMLGQRKTMFLLFAWWLFLCCWVVGLCVVYLKMLDHNIAWESLIGLCMMFVLLVLLYVREVGVDQFPGISGWTRRTGSLMMGLLLVANVGINGWIMMTGSGEDSGQRIQSYIDRGTLPAKYDEYVQRVVPEIQAEDTSFYRTDQLDDGFEKNNTNLVFGGRSLNEYFSTISSDWLYLNKLMGNNAGYNRRMVSLSNDNRSGLDYLMGVKYFLRDENYKASGKPAYVPYGYEYWKTVDGVEIYRNTKCMGIGTGYSKYITESELLQYSPLEREQVMLQAAVVKDRDAESLAASGVKHAKASELKTDVQTVPCRITETNNVTLDGTNGGEMVVSQGENTDNMDPDSNGFTIHVEEQLKNVQIVVSFEEMDRDQFTWDENLKMRGMTVADQGYNKLKEYLYRQDFTGGTSFVISATGGDRTKTAACYKDGNTGLNDVRDYNLNLGYFEEFDGDIRIHLNNAGNYSYDAIKVYAIPMDIYDESTDALDESRFELTSFDNDTVRGTVESDGESVVYFSILNNAGWHVYVDGKEAEKLENVNVAFTGVKVSDGKHEITLEYDYPGLAAGTAVTIAGLAALVAILVRHRRRKKHNVESAA